LRGVLEKVAGSGWFFVVIFVVALWLLDGALSELKIFLFEKIFLWKT
jgi:hypothetical protein